MKRILTYAVISIIPILINGCTRKVYIPIETNVLIKETLRDTVIQIKHDSTIIYRNIEIPVVGRDLDTTLYAETSLAWSAVYIRIAGDKMRTDLQMANKSTQKVQIQVKDTKTYIENTNKDASEALIALQNKYVKVETNYKNYRLAFWLVLFVAIGGVIFLFINRK